MKCNECSRILCSFIMYTDVTCTPGQLVSSVNEVKKRLDKL